MLDGLQEFGTCNFMDFSQTGAGWESRERRADFLSRGMRTNGTGCKLGAQASGQVFTHFFVVLYYL